MNSIKTFWSPELKKERALRKDEATKMAVWKEQYRVVQEETQVGRKCHCACFCESLIPLEGLSAECQQCHSNTHSKFSLTSPRKCCSTFTRILRRMLMKKVGHSLIISWPALVDLSQCSKTALKTGKRMKQAAWSGTPSCLLVQEPSG